MQKLCETGKFERVFASPFFREFAVKCKAAPEKINEAAREAGFVGGFDLGKEYPDLEGTMLFAATEKRTKAEIDAFAERVASV